MLIKNGLIATAGDLYQGDIYIEAHNQFRLAALNLNNCQCLRQRRQGLYL